MADWIIRDGEVLTGQGFMRTDIAIEGCRIVSSRKAPRSIDAAGLKVLPGIIDIHGDGFERQIMPRPNVIFSLDLALTETDRQLVSNGITTAFHGLTVSWEPGLRSIANAEAFVAAWRKVRPALLSDNRLHIRWETFALDAVDTVSGWFDLDPAPILAFNDHTTMSIEKARDQAKVDQWAVRAGLTGAEYKTMLDEVWSRREEVPAAIAGLAAKARDRDLILLAHDEMSVEAREEFRALGVRTSEFPMNRETAGAARAAGEHTVLGGPNVLRGGSHTGAMSAAVAVKEGLCTVLASDYFYPAQLHAAFKLARDGVTDLASAWRLISAHPAEAAGLDDRGVLAEGRRADIVLVDDSDTALPRVRAVFSGGRKVYEAA